MEATAARKPDATPLGNVLRVHDARTNLMLRDQVAMALSALVAVAALAFGIWRWYDAYQHYGPALVSRWTTPSLVAGGVASLFFLAAFIDASRKRHFRVAVCEEGLILQRGRKQIGVRWKGVEALHIQATRYLIPTLNRRQPLRLRLHIRGQDPIPLPASLDDMNTLIEVIKAHTYPALLDSYRQRLDQGHEIIFGPLNVSNTRLQIGKAEYLWENVPRTWLEKGQLCIQTEKDGRGTIRRIAAHKIPNVDLCTQILHHLGQAI